MNQITTDLRNRCREKLVGWVNDSRQLFAMGDVTEGTCNALIVEMLTRCAAEFAKEAKMDPHATLTVIQAQFTLAWRKHNVG